jgi:uncharacterized protein YbaR (Trm112 family)
LIDQQLLEILVCPQCKGGLTLVDGGRGLSCNKCQLKYPIRDDIPILIASEAADLKTGAAKVGGMGAALPKVSFRVMEGADLGLKFQLERGTCRAIGRGETDPNRTMIFNVDLALSLDEGTKNLILQYIAKQFRKTSKSSPVHEGSEQLGMFRRTSDIVLTDLSLSRLHAMIFADEGQVGILDLVSKNGTYVNGQEVESRILQKGDIVEMGETKIVFEG